MITALDTNVLLDVFLADPGFGSTSRKALEHYQQRGALVVCEIVLAELVGCFPSMQEALDALSMIGVQFQPLELQAAARAGVAWKAYRARGGSRQRMLADFLVGAHAESQCDLLLSRDSGYFRTYFPRLTLIDPSA